MKKEPYITKERVVVDRFYNPEYGDDEVCRCGHAYYRHFDTYEDMEPVGCKYCPCYTFQQASCDITEEWVSPVVGGMSLIGVHGKPPHAHANYFWLACGSRVLNFWAENLEAAVKQFDIDEVHIRRYKGEGFDVCLIDDGRIPEDWYLKELCFTGCKVPPVEVLSDIFWFGEQHYARNFKNDLEKFTDPVSYYAKKGWGYHPETGVVSIPVNATPRKLQCDWTIEPLQEIETCYGDGVPEELEREFIKDLEKSVQRSKKRPRLSK